MDSPALKSLVARCAERRARLFETLGEGVLILPTSHEQIRNGDVHHTFRPGSDLAYLTAFPEPEALLVAWPVVDACATCLTGLKSVPV